MNELQKIVVVIDADNTQLSKISDVLREISTRGRIVVKRAYGNWRKDALKNWEAEIKRLAIKAEQQFDYVSGKNATDMALVIDTIELLYTNIYDAFVIVSSDSDYTPLAIKLHESGVYVMGVGEKKSPVSFRNSCDEFLFLENIAAKAESNPAENSGASDSKPTAVDQPDSGSDAHITKLPDTSAAPAAKADTPTCILDANGDPDGIDEIHSLLKKAYDTYQDDDGYVNVATVGDYLKRTKPDFDCRTYCFTKLSQLLEAFPEKYEVKKYKVKDTTVVAYRFLGQDS